MTVPAPLVAGIVSFSYLWAREAKQGLEEGQKYRPCVIVALGRDADGQQQVYLMPITHAPPVNQDHAIEIPAAVKSAIGLDNAPAWIIADETNRSSWPGFDLSTIPNRPGKYFYGILPPGLFQNLKTIIRAIIRNGKLQHVSRN